MSSSNRCRGVRSIQLEISRRVKQEYPRDWAEPMRDNSLRNVYRLEILDDSEGEWCDFIAGTCVCNRPQSVSQVSWSDVFPGTLRSLQ